jgi:hypothetical protein
MSTAENTPPGYYEHIWPSATDPLYDYGGHSRLAELASAKRIETFLIDDTEQLQRWAVRMFLPCSHF